jgi:hypothetical protein
MRNHITIYNDTYDPQSVGWAYRIAGGDSGAIDGKAADAVQRIVDCEKQHDGDHAALRSAIGHHQGDSVDIAGPGMPGNLGELLDV